jgi:replicative DNA helicase
VRPELSTNKKADAPTSASKQETISMMDHIHDLTDSQSPPHHEDSEYATVGCALLDPTGEALRKMTKIIGPADLFGLNDQIVFASCLAVAEAHGCVDIALVHEYLAESGKLAEIDGPMTLLRYMESVNHVAHAEYYARVVLKNSIRRQVIHCARELFVAAWEAHEPLDSLRQRAHVLAEMLESRMSALRSQDLNGEGLQ